MSSLNISRKEKRRPKTMVLRESLWQRIEQMAESEGVTQRDLIEAMLDKQFAEMEREQ